MRKLTPQEQQFLDHTQAQIEEEYEKEYRPLNRVKKFFNTWTTLFFIQFIVFYVIAPFILGLFGSQYSEGMKAFVTQPYMLITILIYITYTTIRLCKKKPKPAIAFIAEQGQPPTTEDK